MAFVLLKINNSGGCMSFKKILYYLCIIIFISSCDMLDDMNARNYDDEARIRFELDYYDLGYGMSKIRVVRFFDNNPATPNDINELINATGGHITHYFYTKPGQYYLEYICDNNNAWYMIYTIEIWKTSGKSEEWDDYLYMGEDNKNDHFVEFEIWLWKDGPQFWDGNFATSGPDPIKGPLRTHSFRTIGDSFYGDRGPIIESLEKKVDGGSMIIEYGRLY
jgi:hypothetical protein